MDRPRICTTRLSDQSFGMNISPKDILVPFFNGHGTNYFRPWKIFSEYAEEIGSTIESTKDNFKVMLDVQHFKPNEINVRVNDQEIIIEGKHEERRDDHGYVSRQFIRKYSLPKECPAETVTSTISTDGVLTIMANKVVALEHRGERMIPIKKCEPCSKDEGAKKCEIKKGTRDEMDAQCSMKKEMKKDESCKKETKMDTCKTDMKIDKVDIKMDKTDMKMEKTDTKMDKTDMRMEKTGMKTDQKEIKEDMSMKMKIDEKETQKMLKEEHCRLLKPELLKDAVSTTEKLISESKKEADELLKLLSTDRQQASTSGASEKLDEVMGLCKTAIADLKKEKVGESMMTSESSSFKSSTMSESIETKESSSFTSISSSMKASSEHSSDLTEIICAELREAAENI